jgi:hypothetical protein
MKKVLSFLFVLALIAGMSFAQAQQTFNFSTTVQKYIEVNPAFLTMDVKTPSISPADVYAPRANYSFYKNEHNIVYANCPFQVQLTGDNGAGDGLPIFARHEVGATAQGWDRLDTKISFSYAINLGLPGTGGWKRIQFGDEGYYGGGVKNAWTNNPYSFTEAPHDGEVGLELLSQATFLHPVPDWSKNNTWDESPDAGDYACQVIATYIAL